MARDEIVHGNMLHISTEDQVQLGRAVRERYNRLIETYRRIRKVPLTIPKSLSPDYHRAVGMIKRHAKGDYRSTAAEWKSLKAVAQWTLDVNAEIRNQPATKLECLE